MSPREELINYYEELIDELQLTLSSMPHGSVKLEIKIECYNDFITKLNNMYG